MKLVWILAALSVSVLLSSQGSNTMATNLTEATRDDVFTRYDNNTDPTSNNTSEWTTARTTPLTPVYKTGLLSSADYNHIARIIGWIYLPLQSLALTLMVLSAVAFLQDRHSPSNIFLGTICIAEALYMTVLFSHNLCKMRRDCFGSLTYASASIWVVSYTGMVSRRSAFFLNGLLSVQRCVAVAFPLHARSFQVLQRPILSLIFVVLLSFLLHLYRPLQYTVVHIEDSEGGSWTQGFSDLYVNNEELFKAFADVAKYIMSYLPMLMSLVCNCLLIAALSRHKKDLRNVSDQNVDGNKNKAESQMTLLILGSTFLMILFNMPVTINEAVAMYSHNYGMLKKEHYLYMVMRHCSSIMSQACDILVVLSYIVLSANFRRRFTALFHPVYRLWRIIPRSTHKNHVTVSKSISSQTIQTELAYLN